MRDVIYNNIRLNEYVIIKNIKESLLPNINNVSLKLNKSAGSLFIKQEMNSRQIVIDIEIIADDIKSRQVILDTLAPMFFVQKEKDLIIDNNRRYKAILDGSTVTEDVMYDSSISLTFIAHDPVAYGAEVELLATNRDNLVNTGNYKAKCVMKLIAESNSVEIKLKNGNEYDYVRVKRVKPGDLIEIDMELEKVTVNGEIYVNYIDALGDFFDIPPGEFMLEIEGTSSVKLTFFERWI